MTSKLTINIPEDLRRKAKARAALENKTLTEIIQIRLEEYAAGLDDLEENADFKTVKILEKRIRNGTESLSDWKEFETELDGLSD